MPFHAGRHTVIVQHKLVQRQAEGAAPGGEGQSGSGHPQSHQIWRQGRRAGSTVVSSQRPFWARAFLPTPVGHMHLITSYSSRMARWTASNFLLHVLESEHLTDDRKLLEDHLLAQQG